MSVNALGATRDASADTSVVGSAVSQATGGQALGQDAFLKLLITQLTNQDPLQPQDDQQFLAQLAQFSTVEGINNLNTSQSHTQGADMLGKTISAVVTQNNVQSAVTGKVTSVRWDHTGVHLSVDSSDADITLDQVQSIE